MAPRKGHIFTPIEARLLQKIAVDANGCWLWTGGTNGCGYGRVRANGTTAYAHRIMYELRVGPIPEGMQLDHLCRNTRCVRPDHLEPVTNRENTLRGKVSSLRPERQTCSRGHDLESHQFIDSQGHRQCKVCHSLRQNAYRERKKNAVQ